MNKKREAQHSGKKDHPRENANGLQHNSVDASKGKIHEEQFQYEVIYSEPLTDAEVDWLARSVAHVIFRGYLSPASSDGFINPPFELKKNGRNDS